MGAAILGALAAGGKSGGYDSFEEAVIHMASLEKKTYLPIPENAEAYNQLLTEYRKLHDYFGLGDNQTMERLKRK